MDKMAQAIAILKAGRSYAEASEVTNIPVEEIMRAWKNETANN